MKNILIEKLLARKFPGFKFIIKKPEDTGNPLDIYNSVGTKVECIIHFLRGKPKPVTFGNYVRFENETDIHNFAEQMVYDIKEIFKKKEYTEDIYKYRWITPKEYIEREKDIYGYCDDEEYYNDLKHKVRYQEKVGTKTRKVKSFEILK
jgi:hypothetical protein